MKPVKILAAIALTSGAVFASPLWPWIRASASALEGAVAQNAPVEVIHDMVLQNIRKRDNDIDAAVGHRGIAISNLKRQEAQRDDLARDVADRRARLAELKPLLDGARGGAVRGVAYSAAQLDAEARVQLSSLAAANARLCALVDAIAHNKAQIANLDIAIAGAEERVAGERSEADVLFVIASAAERRRELSDVVGHIDGNLTSTNVALEALRHRAEADSAIADRHLSGARGPVTWASPEETAARVAEALGAGRPRPEPASNVQ